MDIFSFKNPNATMLMEQGEIINGLTSKMWIERYDEAGEFTFVGPVSGGFRQKLPIGSFVSHTNTPEIMIVENHEINDSQNEESKITITGRGLETYLEQRIIGSNRNFPYVGDLKFLLPAQKTWDQIVHLINQHIHPAYLLDDTYSLNYLAIQSSVPSSTPGDNVSRRLDLRDVYSVILEMMKLDKVGIRIIRPGTLSPPGVAPKTAMLIHKGIDRTKTITFSYDTGEIVNADYLWSNKNLKTSCLITGKWVQTIYNKSGFTNYNRRMMSIQSNLDEAWNEAPDELATGILAYEMQQSGKEALAAQKDINLTKAEVSKRSVDSRYRVDFWVGDLVSVIGDYNENSVMRINEFVEIEDENGSVSYPTLSLDSEE